MIFEPLSKKDLEAVHTATLDILSTTGVVLEGERARKALLDAGCRVDKGRLLLPAGLVEDALRDPVSITIYGVDSSIEMPLTEAVRSYSHNFGSVSVLLEPGGQNIREATAKDLEEFIRISDFLPHLDMVVPSLRPTDFPEEVATLAMTICAFINTRKPVDIGTASDSWEVKCLVEAASVVRGGLDRLKQKPMGTISISPLSPLNFPADITEAIVDCAALGLPITMLPCPTRGLTAPLTLIGGLVQQNAEQLAFLTLAKVINRGTPLLYTCRLAAANMRTGFVGGNDPDLGLSGACAAQIARYYGLPSGVYGLDTGAVLPDIQSGYERAINCLPPVLARATFISGMGLLNGGLLASAEQLVIDDEIYAMLTHRRDGLTVNRETIGLETISAVMEGDNFLAKEHTRDYLRRGELYMGKLGNGAAYEEWLSQGSPDIRQSVKKRLEAILAEHPGPYLDEKMNRELNLLLEKAARSRTGTA
ncbi:MAG: trimethylamine methyltransferase family protein [Bacillota bacterium]